MPEEKVERWEYTTSSVRPDDPIVNGRRWKKERDEARAALARVAEELRDAEESGQMLLDMANNWKARAEKAEAERDEARSKLGEEPHDWR